MFPNDLLIYEIGEGHAAAVVGSASVAESCNFPNYTAHAIEMLP